MSTAEVAKPARTSPQWENLPPSLVKADRWVVWDYGQRDAKADEDGPPSKWTKIPRKALRPDKHASTSKSETWSTFEHAKLSFRTNTQAVDGVGFVLDLPDGRVGVDLDNCLQDGEVLPWARPWVEKLEKLTYGEISPSGKGIKFIGYGKLPDLGTTKSKNGDIIPVTGRKVMGWGEDEAGAVEVYGSRRFFTLTGRIWREDVREVGDLGDLPRDLLGWMDFEHDLREKAKRQAKQKAEAPRNGTAHTNGVHAPQNGQAQANGTATKRDNYKRKLACDVTNDEDVWTSIRRSAAKGGRVASRLLALYESSGPAGYQSDSEADQALCNDLAFWFQRDFDRVKAQFVASERGKRDKAQRDDYLDRTIQKAIDGTGDTWSPFYKGEPGGTLGPEDDDRMTVEVSTDVHLTVDAAVEALGKCDSIYQRGHELVTVLRSNAGKEGRIEYREPGSPRIAPVPSPKLCEILSRVARFVKFDKRSDDLVPTRVPTWAADMVAARGEWDDIRHIEGVTEAPTVRPDGSILDRKGYDRATGLLFEPNAEFPPIPTQPTREQARAAADRLFDLVSDFPFVDDNHKAAWLAGLLTVVGRYAIPGPCPLFLVDGNAPGAGKSWLCDLVAIIATGREMPRSSYRDDDAEMAKAILSIAIDGVRLVLFDNVPTGFKIGGGALDRALTGRTFQDRILGKIQMSPETPLDAVFWATGNNLGLKGDALRRIIPCRLESAEERPEERTGFKIPDIKAHARENRGEYLVSAMTILRAHAVAGRPSEKLTPMSYPEWCRVIRDAVHWATGLDPAQPRNAVQDHDENTQQRLVLVKGWAKLCEMKGAAEKGCPPDRDPRKDMTAAEGIKALREMQMVLDTPVDKGAKDCYAEIRNLRDLLSSWCDDGGLPKPRVLGNEMGKERGRPTEEGSLEFRTSAGNRRWYVKPKFAPRPTSPPGGSGDSGDSLTIPREKNCQIDGLGGAPIGRNGTHLVEDRAGTKPPEPPEPPVARKRDAARWLAGFLRDRPQTDASVYEGGRIAPQKFTPAELILAANDLGVEFQAGDDAQLWHLKSSDDFFDRPPTKAEQRLRDRAIYQAGRAITGALWDGPLSRAKVVAMLAPRGFDEAIVEDAAEVLVVIRQQTDDGEVWSLPR